MKNLVIVAALLTFGVGAMGATGFSQPSLDAEADRAVDARLRVVLKGLLAEHSH